ncbi:MAG TPA: hypothetical protein VMT58_00900 [Candidatus Binataceae bacterium]|nr:hypothetical protein [Candidatus Binataceae bacterium]
MAERGFRAHMSHPVGGVDRNMQGLGADRVRKFNDLLDAYCDGEIADESYD